MLFCAGAFLVIVANAQLSAPIYAGIHVSKSSADQPPQKLLKTQAQAQAVQLQFDEDFTSGNSKLKRAFTTYLRQHSLSPIGNGNGNGNRALADPDSKFFESNPNFNLDAEREMFVTSLEFSIMTDQPTAHPTSAPPPTISPTISEDDDHTVFSRLEPTYSERVSLILGGTVIFFVFLLCLYRARQTSSEMARPRDNSLFRFDNQL